ncbi:lysozyme [Chitinimonas koreensis]|nr:lysozyme [Chitinimonas koreensis]
MKISQRGLDLICRFEGLRLTAYLCPAGVLTIGYGHTGPDVHERMTITEAQARALLEADANRFAAEVADMLTINTSQDQFDALVSFAYNVGAPKLRGSTLLRRHNAGRFSDAASQFAVWNKAGGKVLAGLEARRRDEAMMYRGVWR